MDVTPVTHRVRRGRIALGKCNSKNVQSYPNATLASSERTGSPETSPLFISTPTTSSHTPSSGIKIFVDTVLPICDLQYTHA